MRSTDAKALLSSIVLGGLVSCTGCQLIGNQEPLIKHHRPALVEKVTTGGVFAKSTALQIPEQGLTLGDAVSTSLREGVKDLGLNAAPASRIDSTEPAEMPLEKTPVPPPQSAIDAVVRLTKHVKADGSVPAVHLRAVVNGVRPPGLSEPLVEERSSQLREFIVSEAKVLANPDASVDPSSLSEVQLEFARNLDRVANGKPANDDVAGETPAPSADETTSAKTEARKRSQSIAQTATANPIVVTLQRTGEPTRVIPLSMVQLTQVGDVWLRDGDRIEVIPFSRTSLSQRNQQRGLVSKLRSIEFSGLLNESVNAREYRDLRGAASALTSNYSHAIDLIVLRPVLLDGDREEYWFPRLESLAYKDILQGNSTIDQRIIGGDEVEFSALRLKALIREGQLRGKLRASNLLDRTGGALQKFETRKRKAADAFVREASPIPGVQSLSQGMRRLRSMF
ncbi:MAG: hypothetical protein AAFX06_32870 [Planctomycetota bacterium]